MSNIKKFSPEKAQLLREKGYSYKQISSILGCSESWCKKNLVGSTKGVLKDTNVEKAISDTKEKIIAVLERALIDVRSVQ